MLGDSEVSAIHLPKVYKGIIRIPALCHYLPFAEEPRETATGRGIRTAAKPHLAREDAKERATRIPITEPFCTSRATRMFQF
jgi:hypothetical protein